MSRPFLFTVQHKINKPKIYIFVLFYINLRVDRDKNSKKTLLGLRKKQLQLNHSITLHVSPPES